MAILSEGLRIWNGDIATFGQPDVSWCGIAFNGGWVMWFQPTSDTIKRVHKTGSEMTFNATSDLKSAIDTACNPNLYSELPPTKSKTDFLREAEGKLDTAKILLLQARSIMEAYTEPTITPNGNRYQMQVEAVIANSNGYLK